MMLRMKREDEEEYQADWGGLFRLLYDTQAYPAPAAGETPIDIIRAAAVPQQHEVY